MYSVCFISRGSRGGQGPCINDYGLLFHDGSRLRVSLSDDGTRHTLDGPPTPEMLAAINDYERQKHDAMVWPEYLGDKPQFTPPVPEAGIQPCRMISPYGSFI